MKFSRKIAPGKERLDEVLRAVRRTGIADDPASDVVSDRRQAALEICHLVLDDHVQAKALIFHHRQTFSVSASNCKKFKPGNIVLDALGQRTRCSIERRETI